MYSFEGCTFEEDFQFSIAAFNYCHLTYMNKNLFLSLFTSNKEMEEPKTRISFFGRLRAKFRCRSAKLISPQPSLLTLDKSGSKILFASRRFGSNDEATGKRMIANIQKTLKSLYDDDDFAVFDCGSNATRLFQSPSVIKHMKTFPADLGSVPKVDTLISEANSILNWLSSGTILIEDYDPVINNQRLRPSFNRVAVILCGNTRHWIALMTLISTFRQPQPTMLKFRSELKRWRLKKYRFFKKSVLPSQNQRLEATFRFFPKERFENIKLRKIIISHAPIFDDSKRGSRVRLMVTNDQDLLIYSAQAGQDLHPNDNQIVFSVNKIISGDIRVKVFHVSTSGSQEMFSFWFHTADFETLNENSCLEFEKSHLDCPTEREGRFNENFRIGIIASPAIQVSRSSIGLIVCNHCFKPNQLPSTICAYCHRNINSLKFENVLLESEPLEVLEEEKEWEDDPPESAKLKQLSNLKLQSKISEAVMKIMEMFPCLPRSKLNDIRKHFMQNWADNAEENQTLVNEVIQEILSFESHFTPEVGCPINTPLGSGIFQGNNICVLNDGEQILSYKLKFPWGTGFIQKVQCSIMLDFPTPYLEGASQSPLLPQTTQSQYDLDEMIARSLQAEFDEGFHEHRISHSTSVTSLPVHTFVKRKGVTKNHGDSMCMVCQHQFQPGDQLRTLPCFHQFHVECVDGWLFQKGRCPLCKTDINEHIH